MSNIRTERRQRTVALALALVLAAACSKSGDDKPRLAEPTTERSTSTTEAAATTTTTEKPPDTFKVGDRVETARGNHITLHAYEQPVPAPEFDSPNPGQEFAAADVEFCADVDTGDPDFPAYNVGPGDWELQMADNTRRSFDIGVKEPAMNYTDVAKGDCLRGWVSYQVPAGERPVFLIALNTEPIVKFTLS